MPLIRLMKYNEENIRLILGLKIRQLRIDKELQLKTLAQSTGISISYLNEIEKGKKNPKPAKLAIIAEALDVSYDWLVSLQLGSELGPFSNLLQSDLLQQLPLETFGINRASLVELFAQEPANAASLVAAIRNTAQVAGFDMDLFNRQAIRAYKEMRKHHFSELESAVLDLCRTMSSKIPVNPNAEQLRNLLVEEFKYSIESGDFVSEGLYAVFLKKNRPVLLMNRLLGEERKKHMLAREIAFSALNLQNRPGFVPGVNNSGFEVLLNDFKANYFAAALLTNGHRFKNDVEAVFSSKQWQPWKIEDILSQFRLSPELFILRLLAILPQNSGTQRLFYSRMEKRIDEKRFDIVEEAHINDNFFMHETQSKGHYCRRWSAIRSLNELESELSRRKVNDEKLIEASIIRDISGGDTFLSITIAESAYPMRNSLISYNLSILLEPEQTQKVGFLEDPKLKSVELGHLCETCTIASCRERVAEFEEDIRKKRSGALNEALRGIVENYSK